MEVRNTPAVIALILFVAMVVVSATLIIKIFGLLDEALEPLGIHGVSAAPRNTAMVSLPALLVAAAMIIAGLAAALIKGEE